MEFLQLLYFRHSAKTESFSETAREFGVPPSSVSLAVKRLEKEIGASLFDRTANRLALNDKGRRFLLAAQSVFDTLAEAKASLIDPSAEPSGEIKILICTNRRILTEKIAAFRMRYPRVSFSIHHGKAIAAEGVNYDIVVSDTPPKRKHLALPLVEEEMMLAVHEEHPLANEQSVSLASLGKERFIAMTKGTCLREYTERLFREGGICPEVAIECDDPYYIREYLRIALGVAVVPSVSWKNQFAEQVRLLRIENGQFRQSHLYLLSGATAAARLFAESAARTEA